MKTNWLATRRGQLKLTQANLAAQLQLKGFSITAAAISHWETGRHKPPLEDSEFRNALAEILKMDVPMLLELAGYEVTEGERSSEAKRAAYIIDHLPPEKRAWALEVLESFLNKSSA